MLTKREEETTAPSTVEEERGGVRIHVGGLGQSVGRDDLLKIFSPMGSVEAVDFVRTKGRSFAYINFSPSSHNSLTKLFSTYNGCVWKGGKLRLEKAKEHYLAKLKREWDEERSADTATCLPKPPSEASESTHLKIFFPRLRKVKAVPFTGTGKHKYSFQRVEVPSVQKHFCDCEEHSASHALQGNRSRDVESHYVGVNEEELNIMNSVMNRLFRANGEQETESLLANGKDDDIVEEEEEDEDGDNLVINVISNNKTTLPLSRNWEQETDSRKRKSVQNGTQEHKEGYTRGEKRNLHEGSRETREGSGAKKSRLEIPENSEPSEVVPDKSSSRPGSGENRSSTSVSRSQKSSWKSLLASANDSKFSVSSVLSGVSSSKEEQHTSSNSAFVNLPVQESVNLKGADTPNVEGSAVKSAVKKRKSTSKTPRKTGKSVAAETTNVEAEPMKLESSFRDSAMDSSIQNSPDKEIIGGTDINPVTSSLLTSAKDDQLVPENSDAERDVHKEIRNLTEEENAGNNSDEGKGTGTPKAFNRAARGSSWRQKSSWIQLVSEKNSSFSITQLFSDSNPENHEP